MVRWGFSSRAALVVLAVAAAVAAPGSGVALAAPAPPPPPGGSLPEGPWPPDQVLATSPDQVAVPEVSPSVTSCPAAPYGVHYYAPGSGKTVALTFDDGPGPGTMQILSILQNAQVPATFFNLGVNSAVRPLPVRSTATVGELLGNHTWDHPEMTTLSAAAQGSEMDQATAEQVSLVGFPPCAFRPPYGAYNATTLSAAQQRHLVVWNWSVDTEDWKAGTSTTSYWVNRIITRAEAGGSQQHPVVLMHNPPAGVPATVIALPTIIAYYRSHGYTFVDLLGRTGYGTPGPASATTAAGTHVFVRASSGGLAERTRRSGTWSAWSQLGGAIVAGPGATAASASSTAVVAAGTDNHLWYRTVADTGAVSGWMDLGGLATSKPAIATGPGGTLSVVVRSTNGGAWLRERVGGAWGGWQSLGGLLAGAPAVAATADGRLTVAVVSSDDALWVKNRSGATWSAWRRVGGVVTADPALSATVGGTRLVAVVRGGDRAGYVNVLNTAATSWGSWSRLGGTLGSAPTVTTDGSTVAAVVYGTNQRLYRNVAATGTTATGWSGWQILPT